MKPTTPKRIRVKPGKLVLAELSDQEQYILAKYGDKEAAAHIWAHSVPLAERIAGRFSAKYPWVVTEDLLQDILLQFPKIIKRFNETRGTPPAKYLYHCYYRAAQDALRRLDHLGMRFPQRKKHPAFSMLSDLDDMFGSIPAEDVLHSSHENMHRGYFHREATEPDADRDGWKT